MSNRHRLALRYGVLGVLSVAACVFAAVKALDREVSVPRTGLVPGITDELQQDVPARAPALSFERVAVDFRHFPGKRTRRLPEDMGSGVALEEPERGRFEAAYAALVARAYPPRPDGRTLFPFRRLFIVARAR